MNLKKTTLQKTTLQITILQRMKLQTVDLQTTDLRKKRKTGRILSPDENDIKTCFCVP